MSVFVNTNMPDVEKHHHRMEREKRHLVAYRWLCSDRRDIKICYWSSQLSIYTTSTTVIFVYLKKICGHIRSHLLVATNSLILVRIEVIY